MKKIAILITDDISAFHLSVPLAIFADIIPDHSLFNVVLCSVQGKTIKTSLDLPLYFQTSVIT